MTQHRVRIAHIGLGRIGIGHANALLANPHVDLVVANRTHERAEAYANANGCTALSIDSVMNNPSGFDGVVIASSTDTHEPLVLQAIDAGLPFFVEKPLASTLEGMRRIAERLDETNLPHHIGFNRRFDPGYQQARKDVQAGVMGPITRITMTACDAVPPPAAFIATSGGMFADMAVHDYDILRWVTGREVEWVYAIGAVRGEDHYTASNDVDEAMTLMQLDDGTLVSQNLSRQNGAGYDIRMELYGQQSMRAVGLHRRTPFISTEPDATYPLDEPYPTFDTRFEEGFIHELGGFVDMVRHGTPSACTYEDAIEATLIALSAQRSREEGRKVSISELRDA